MGKRLFDPWVDEVHALDEYQKTKVYLHYYCRSIKLENDFFIVDILGPYGLHGWGKPHKQFKNIAFYYCKNRLKIKTYAEFVSPKNIRVKDMGPNWQKNGFGDRWSVNYFGIYYWWPRFKDEIDIHA